MKRRLLKTTLALTATGVTGVIVLLTLLWSEHNSELTLPTPTGPFAVGRVTDAWVDDKHVDPFAEAPGTRRELVVWMWYPSTRSPTAKAADYLPAAWRGALAHHRGVLLRTFLTRDLALVHSHSVVDATLSPEQPTYPIVILRAGLGALTTDYTTLAEDLASHGYVVVGFDAPYRTALVVFPDGRVVTRPPVQNPETMVGEARDRMVARLLAAWTGDIEFVVDRLERLNASATSKFHGKLDLQALGVVGHSLGGATAAQFCHDDPRCRAGIDLDGAPRGSVVQEGLHQPFMFLLSDHGDTSDPVSRQIMANIQSIYDRLPPNGRLRIVLRGANHFSFSDQMLLRSQRLIGLLQLARALRLATTRPCRHRRVRPPLFRHASQRRAGGITRGAITGIPRASVRLKSSFAAALATARISSGYSSPARPLLHVVLLVRRFGDRLAGFAVRLFLAGFAVCLFHDHR